MATEQDVAAVPAPEVEQAITGKSCGCKHHFSLYPEPEPRPCTCKKLRTPRKIHAASAVILLGFLSLHFLIAATGLRPTLYQAQVNRLHSLVVNFPALTVLAILLPFILQSVTGIYLLHGEGLRYYTGKCDRGGRVRFFFQRWTGVVILGFLFVHVLPLHVWGFHQLYRLTRWSAFSRYSAGGIFQPDNAFQSTVQGFRYLGGSEAFLTNTVLSGVLLVGIWAVSFHLANGAWSGALLWKILPSENIRPAWRIICFAMGILLIGLGSIGWWAFTSVR